METALVDPPPELGGVYRSSSELQGAIPEDNEFYQDFTTSKSGKLMNNNNNNNNNNDDKSCGNGIISGMTVTSSVNTATADCLSMADHITVCSSPPASSNSVTSSSPTNDVVPVTSHAMSLQIPTDAAANDDEEDDDYACDTPTSLSPSRDIVGVTSPEKSVQVGSSTSLPTTPRSGSTSASMASSRLTPPMYGSHSSIAAAVAARCPPVREAVDPAKYITLTGESDGVKYACSKCGNVYKWRKSLNKHWKEKHDGETPDPPGSVSPAARLMVAATGHQQQYQHGHGINLNRHTSPSAVLGKHPAPLSTYGSGGRSVYVGRNSMMKASPEEPGSTPVVGAVCAAFRQPTKGSLAALNPSLFGKFTLNPPRSANRINSHHHHGQPQHHHQHLQQQHSPLNVASGAAAWSPRHQSGFDTSSKSHSSNSSISGGFKTADYFRSTYGSTSPMDGLLAQSASGRAEKPVDLSESSRPYRPSKATVPDMTETGSDPGVLDLSKKYPDSGGGRWSSGKPSPDDYFTVQDEPLDFSTKVTSSSRSPTNDCFVAAVPPRASSATGQHLPLSCKYSLLDNVPPMSSVSYHAGVIPLSPVISDGLSSERSFLRCSYCPMKFSSSSKLDRHFTRDHADLMIIPQGAESRRQLLGCETGSGQLYRYLTADSSAPISAHHSGTAAGSGSVSCLICGKWFPSQLSLAKHCEDDHATIGSCHSYRPQAVHVSAAKSNRVDVDEPPCKKQAPMMILDGRRNNIRSDSNIQTSDDIKAEMLFPHCDDDQTAIVIPQAPDDASSNASSLVSKVFASTAAQPRPHSASSKVNGGSVGRSRRAELLGFVASGSSSSVGGSAAAAEALLPFKCQLCEYRARWPSEMTQHAKNHSDEKPFRCPQCSYRSKWKWDVVKHLKRCGGGNCTASDVIDMSASCGRGQSGTAVAANNVTDLRKQNQREHLLGASNTFKGNSQRRRRFQTVLINPAVIEHQFQQQQSPQQTGDFIRTEHKNGSMITVVIDNGKVEGLTSDRHVTQNTVLNGEKKEIITASDVTGSERSDDNNDSFMPPDKSTASDTPLPAVKLEQFVDEMVSMVTNGDDDDIQKMVTSPVNVAVSGDSSTVNDSSSAGAQGQGLHYCVQCAFVGHSPAELRRHQRVHSDEKPYSCRTCSYSSKWKCDLKKHLRAYNHVSAVPLVYGGHGRKPSLPVDWDLGQMGLTDPRDLVGLVRDSDFFDQPPVFDDAAATDEGRSGDDRFPKGHRHSGTGNGLAAGITTGGRLRCRRCDFEAVDITSFLQHKSLHHSGYQSNGFVKDVGGREVVPLNVVSAMNESTSQTSQLKMTSPISGHRRKSSKQNRVPQQSGDATDLSASDGRQTTLSSSVDHARSGLGEHPNEEERFWTSLGLKSRGKNESESGKSKPNTVANACHQPTQSSSVDATMTVEGNSSWNVGILLPSGLSVASAPSPGGSSNGQDDVTEADNGSILSETTSGTYETDMEYAEVDDAMKSVNVDAEDSWGEPVDLCNRSAVKTDGPKEKENIESTFDSSRQLQHQQQREDLNSTSTARVPARRHWSWSKGIEGCSWRTSLDGAGRQYSSAGPMTDADELAQSRRKRKLRTCDKCGYVTDNLTTLQRHTAKHGSTGRHRCSLCTYTVERQHILDYHIKIVHGGTSTTNSNPSDAAVAPSSSPTNTSSLLGVDFENTSTPVSSEQLTNGVTFGLDSAAVRTNLAAVASKDNSGSSYRAGDESSSTESLRPRAGLGVGRSCIRCGFVAGTDGSAARHRLIGHSGQGHQCNACDRRTTTARIMAAHRAQVHPVPLPMQNSAPALAESKSAVRGGVYMCRECPYRSLSPSHVSSHGRLHAPPDRKHRCPECTYSVDRLSLLGQHQRLHRQLVEEKRLRSQDEDSQIVPPSAAEHRNQPDVFVRRLRCHHCPFRCHNAGQLSIHRRHHLNVDDRLKSFRSTSSRRYKCDQCSFGVDVRNALEHHRKLHRSRLWENS